MGRKQSGFHARLMVLCVAGLLGFLLPAQLAGATGDPIRDVPIERVPGGDLGGTPPGGTTGGGLGGGGTGTPVVPAPTSDLSLTKTIDRANVATGDHVGFTMAVTNAGPDSSPVTVTDTLAPGLTFVGGGSIESATQWSCSAFGQVVTCTRGENLNASGNGGVEIEVAVDAGAAPTGTPTTVTNIAVVNGPNADPDQGNNSSLANFTVIPITDVTISKTHSGDFTVNALKAWPITVHNLGPGVSRDTVVVDTPPPGFVFAGLEGDPNGWSCSQSPSGGFGCFHSAPLGLGDSTINVLVHPIPSRVTLGPVTNTASVSARNEGPFDEDDNSATDTASLRSLADLEIDKSHSGNFTHGEHGTYTVTVRNRGPADQAPFEAAGPITVTDLLQPGLGYVAAGSGGDGWSCPNADVPAENTSPVVCTHAGGLGIGASTSFTLIADVPSDLAANGPVHVGNFVTVTSATPDPAEENNSDLDDATVVDSISPSLTVPSDITKSNDPGLTTTVVTYTASASDNYAGVTLSCSPPSGNAFPLGATTVTCTATDTSGNTASKSFQVTVIDTEPPSVTVPADITKSNDPGLATAVVNYSASASDNAPAVALSCNPPSASAFPLGATTVTCTATDGSGNTASKSFQVTVSDTEPPSITAPADITKSTDPGLATAVVTYAPTATDNAPGVTVACNPPSGTAFPLGTTTVTCTATDTTGNTAAASFAVTVVDTEPPSVTVPADITQSATSPSGAVVNFSVTAADNAPGVTVACVPPSGSTFAIGVTTVTCTATDGSGNTASKSFNISVLGAVDQLNNLVNRVKGMQIEPGFKSELLNRLNNALKALSAQKTGQACVELNKFIAGATSKSGKKLLGANATTLIGDANRIKQVLAC